MAGREHKQQRAPVVPAACRLVLAACLSIAVGAPAGAATTYRYEGHAFDLIRDQTPPLGTYTADMSVSGWFSVETALASNPLTDIRTLVVAYEFFDGRQTLDEANSDISEFSIAVGDGGEVSAWNISVWNPGTNLIDTHNFRYGFDDIRIDAGSLLSGGPSFDAAFARNSPGSWTVVPAPGAAWLLTPALAVLTTRLRRRPPAPVVPADRTAARHER